MNNQSSKRKEVHSKNKDDFYHHQENKEIHKSNFFFTYVSYDPYSSKKKGLMTNNEFLHSKNYLNKS
jgi:hypothetical protein